MKYKHTNILPLYAGMFVNFPQIIIFHNAWTSIEIVSVAGLIFSAIYLYEKQHRAWRLEVIKRLRNERDYPDFQAFMQTMLKDVSASVGIPPELMKLLSQQKALHPTPAAHQKFIEAAKKWARL